MKQHFRLALVLVGLLSFITAISSVRTGAKTCNKQQQEKVCNNGVTSFVLFRVIS